MLADNPRLLIVDDIEVNRAILTRRLVPGGFEITEADGGRAALDLIERQEFDLVLLDIMMPEIGGIEVLKRIRQTFSPSALPVIMVTAKDEGEGVVEALELGANDYVTKPIDFPVARARIQAQLARKRAEEALHRANEELEERVAARTAELSQLNAKLETEIEERRAVTTDLRVQNLRFDAALSNMSQGLCMFDAEQRLVVCNRRFLEMYGFSPEVVRRGTSLRAILEYSIALGNIPKEAAEQLLADRLQHAVTGEEIMLHQHLNDGRIIAILHGPMPDGGSLVTYQDVTEQVRSEQDLRAYSVKLEQSNRELQDFAFIASHDMQEPLRKIEAFGDRLQTKFGATLGDDGRLYLDRMQSAAKRMRALINDLLSYSRVTTKAQPFGSVALTDIAREVVSDLQVRIDELNADVRIERLPVIAADPMQMRQLLQNLLSNALKFRKPDTRPAVTIAGRVLDPAEAQGGDLCEITVADNGIGFEEKYLDRIFGMFQRLHGKGEYEGTGIGLATVRKIVERHEGAITAKSAPGEGATFIVSLPVRQANLEFAA